jgi:hypothetical protein
MNGITLVGQILVVQVPVVAAAALEELRGLSQREAAVIAGGKPLGQQSSALGRVVELKLASRGNVRSSTTVVLEDAILKSDDEAAFITAFGIRLSE